MRHPHHFDHETLQAYQLLAEVARWYLESRFPRGAAKLKAQGVEAAQSAALNVAEGRARAGQARRNHYEIALGSAAEACAALDMADVPGGAEQQQKLRRAGAMLKRLGG